MNAAIAPLPRLRALHARDLPALMAIETAAYEFPWTAGIFRDCLSAGYECWVLEDGSELLGYGVLSAAAGEAHILNVCVAPAQQRRGLGRMLVRRLLDLARWHKAAQVFLEVRPSNPHAIALYLSEGFRQIGVRKGYYPASAGREDAIVMGIELSVRLR
ncbi:MAG: ribosomal protein S18-alanine N-acetyltransferase [Proteobacteria bacterium]|nr:ribosomal protein S18-alanine N-acetyltransferase [Pseudomonadota bacterium]MBS0465120.1 ribosomal protein S18-alanine N-acetyltransferase [Pseudomonadota bacterium]